MMKAVSQARSAVEFAEESMKRVLRSSVAVLLAAIAASVPFASACDAGFVADVPSAVCEVAGEQCQLEAGPLGVCERTECATREDSACFECVSQH